jgi:hypothetical protein
MSRESVEGRGSSGKRRGTSVEGLKPETRNHESLSVAGFQVSGLIVSMNGGSVSGKREYFDSAC